MNQLLAALGSDIKKSGKNWTARCPCHKDKDFAMSIKECEDGSIVAYCFSCGANGLDLYRTLQLDLSELFGKTLERESNYASDAIRDEYLLEQFVMLIYRGDVKAGKTISIVDRKRAKLAEAKIKGMKDKYNL